MRKSLVGREGKRVMKMAAFSFTALPLGVTASSMASPLPMGGALSTTISASTVLPYARMLSGNGRRKGRRRR